MNSLALFCTLPTSKFSTFRSLPCAWEHPLRPRIYLIFLPTFHFHILSQLLHDATVLSPITSGQELTFHTLHVRVGAKLLRTLCRFTLHCQMKTSEPLKVDSLSFRQTIFHLLQQLFSSSLTNIGIFTSFLFKN